MNITKPPWDVTPDNDLYGCYILHQAYDEQEATPIGDSSWDNVAEHDANNARLMGAAPDLLQACKCALADLEGIMPEHDPDGDRTHPGWQTIKELRVAINKATGEVCLINTYKCTECGHEVTIDWWNENEELCQWCYDALPTPYELFQDSAEPRSAGSFAKPFRHA